MFFSLADVFLDLHLARPDLKSPKLVYDLMKEKLIKVVLSGEISNESHVFALDISFGASVVIWSIKTWSIELYILFGILALDSVCKHDHPLSSIEFILDEENTGFIR
jgi:hypothetical protein